MFIEVFWGDKMMDGFYFPPFQNLDLLNYLQKYSLLINKGKLKINNKNIVLWL